MITSEVQVVLRDSTGRVKWSETKPNLIVTVGHNALATWLAQSTQSVPFMSWVGLGSGTTPPIVSNTALESEFSGGGYVREQGALTSSTSTRTVTALFPAGVGTGSISELGLFSANSAGTMFARLVVTPRVKDAGDTLTVTWTHSF